MGAFKFRVHLLCEDAAQKVERAGGHSSTVLLLGGDTDPKGREYFGGWKKINATSQMGWFEDLWGCSSTETTERVCPATGA